MEIFGQYVCSVRRLPIRFTVDTGGTIRELRCPRRDSNSQPTYTCPHPRGGKGILGVLRTKFFQGLETLRERRKKCPRSDSNMQPTDTCPIKYTLTGVLHKG